MKQLKTLLLATALCIGTISFTQAQSKVAHINSQSLVEAMPSYKTAMAELDKLQKSYDADISGMGNELQKTLEANLNAKKKVIASFKEVKFTAENREQQLKEEILSSLTCAQYYSFI